MTDITRVSDSSISLKFVLNRWTNWIDIALHQLKREKERNTSRQSLMNTKSSTNELNMRQHKYISLNWFYKPSHIRVVLSKFFIAKLIVKNVMIMEFKSHNLHSTIPSHRINLVIHWFILVFSDLVILLFQGLLDAKRSTVVSISIKSLNWLSCVHWTHL